MMLIKVEALTLAEDDVGNLLIILMWRTSSEVLCDDLFDVEVWLHDRLLKSIVDVLDVH